MSHLGSAKEKLTAIPKPFKFEEVRDEFNAAGGVGMTLAEVEGSGLWKGGAEQSAAREDATMKNA